MGNGGTKRPQTWATQRILNNDDTLQTELATETLCVRVRCTTVSRLHKPPRKLQCLGKDNE